MIKINLSKIMGEKRIKQCDISKATKIRPGTINSYYHEYIKKMNVQDLDKLCKFLDCQVSDLLEYIPD